MIKKILGSLLIFGGLGAAVFAQQPMVAEAPINNVGTAATISITTFSWTAAPTTATVGRMGILVNNPSTNNARMVGILSTDCDGSIAPATTIRPLEFAPATDFTYLGISDKTCLYLMSLHTAVENVHVQDVRQ